MTADEISLDPLSSVIERLARYRSGDLRIRELPELVEDLRDLSTTIEAEVHVPFAIVNVGLSLIERECRRFDYE